VQEHNARTAPIFLLPMARHGSAPSRVRSIYSGQRGLIDATVEVQILDHGLHSGTFGGPALDAVTLLARLIATFHDEAGDVAVAGLPAAGDPTLDISEEEYRQDSGLRSGAMLTGSGSIASRLWTKPALSVIGLNAPDVAVASNTLLPSASAKVSLRLVPGSDSAAAMDALRHHVQAHAPFGADARFTPGSMTSPFAADTAGADGCRRIHTGRRRARGQVSPRPGTDHRRRGPGLPRPRSQ
jgi:cysteinylglycine-S-conjugate dipeptidase